MSSPEGDWLLALVPLAAWWLLDALRQAEGHRTRSEVADELLRRAIASEGVAA